MMYTEYKNTCCAFSIYYRKPRKIEDVLFFSQVVFVTQISPYSILNPREVRYNPGEYHQV